MTAAAQSCRYSGFHAGQGVPRDIRLKVVDMVDRCFEVLSKPEHNLPKLDKGNLFIEITDFGDAGFGGHDMISVDYETYKFMTQYREYEWFDSDTEIGGFLGSPDLCLEAITAHEVAHHIDMCYVNPRTNHFDDERLGHGKEWEGIYRILRKTLINPKRIINGPFLEDFDDLKEFTGKLKELRREK